MSKRIGISKVTKQLSKISSNLARGYEAARRVFERGSSPDLIRTSFFDDTFFIGKGIYELFNSKKIKKYYTKQGNYTSKYSTSSESSLSSS